MSKVLILDFGSQYTQLIARRIREERVYCVIEPCTAPMAQIKAFAPDAIILSGGPASVLAKKSPKMDLEILDLGVPVLGICYGMQLITYLLGGKVIPAKKREYGKAVLKAPRLENLFAETSASQVVWMSHGDSLEKLPTDFTVAAETENGIVAAIENPQRKIHCLQFHPEVVHTEFGRQILRNFLFNIAKLNADWDMKSFIDEMVPKIRHQVGNEKVILGLSGGVDSSVAAVLLHKAIGNQLTCIFINNGLLRQDEAKKVKEVFLKHYKIRLKYVDASAMFLKALKKVHDPETKRKRIGRLFVKVFEAEAKKIKNVKFLSQGTLYPDVIESVSFKGPSAVIKSHHNVGGLPKKMGLKLVEPFRELFKDEVRAIGTELGMPDIMVHRQPFPGPGLAIRIIGDVTPQRLELLRKADVILMDEIRASGWYRSIWQGFCVLLPIKSVGVMGDERTYENVCALRLVTSIDGMTADWAELPKPILERISNRIINEVRGINRVVYDISSKPPATIEWE